MRLIKTVHINTYLDIGKSSDFLLGARITVHVGLEDQDGRDIAYGIQGHQLEAGDYIAVMTGEDFLKTPLGKRLLEQATSKLLDEVARKAAALEGVKEAIAGGVL